MYKQNEQKIDQQNDRQKQPNDLFPRKKDGEKACQKKADEQKKPKQIFPSVFIKKLPQITQNKNPFPSASICGKKGFLSVFVNISLLQRH